MESAFSLTGASAQVTLLETLVHINSCHIAGVLVTALAPTALTPSSALRLATLFRSEDDRLLGQIDLCTLNRAKQCRPTGQKPHQQHYQNILGQFDHWFVPLLDRRLIIATSLGLSNGRLCGNFTRRERRKWNDRLAGNPQSLCGFHERAVEHGLRLERLLAAEKPPQEETFFAANGKLPPHHRNL